MNYLPTFADTDVSTGLVAKLTDMVSTYWLELIGVLVIGMLIGQFVRIMWRMIKAGM